MRPPFKGERARERGERDREGGGVDGRVTDVGSVAR